MIRSGAKGRIYSLYEIAVILFYCVGDRLHPVSARGHLHLRPRPVDQHRQLHPLARRDRRRRDGRGDRPRLLVRKDTLRAAGQAERIGTEFVYLMFITRLRRPRLRRLLRLPRAATAPYIANILVVYHGGARLHPDPSRPDFFKFDYMKRSEGCFRAAFLLGRLLCR
ncbi:MAG: hypothetical protein MZU97_11730 [Bacillus subtilis]|nr:hypothetical protein [Bacillus subtilis]